VIDNENDFDALMDSDEELVTAVSSAPRFAQPDPEAPAPAPILFEGRTVDRTEISIKGLTALSEAYDGLKIGLDDRVRLVVETRAARVNHYVDKDGQLVRSQELRVSVADIIPWDPTNPADDGVIRA
jgi:hypothetical protein